MELRLALTMASSKMTLLVMLLDPQLGLQVVSMMVPLLEMTLDFQ